MGPLDHHATIVARMQNDIDEARRGWALAYDDGSPRAGTPQGGRIFARNKWGEAEAARLFEDAAVARDNPGAESLRPARLPEVVVNGLLRDAQAIAGRFWPPGYHSLREVVEAIAAWGGTLLRLVPMVEGRELHAGFIDRSSSSGDASAPVHMLDMLATLEDGRELYIGPPRDHTVNSDRAAWLEQRVAALRAEKKLHLQRMHGFVRCEACRSIIDTSIGECGRDYLHDDDGAYLCRACWPEPLHQLIADTTTAIEAAVGETVPYTEDNIERVQDAIGGVISKAIEAGHIGPAVDVVVRPVDPASRIVDVEVTIDKLRGRVMPTLAEDALRSLVGFTERIRDMKAAHDMPGLDEAIGNARAVLGMHPHFRNARLFSCAGCGHAFERALRDGSCPQCGSKLVEAP